MHRLATATVASSLLLLLSAVPAVAHVGAMPGLIAPGGTVASEIVFVHGCGPDGTIPTDDTEGSPTEAVTINVPDGISVTPRPDPAWTTAVDGRALRFEAVDPKGVVGVVRLPVTIAADAGAPQGDTWLPTVQSCTDGEQMRWTYAGVEQDGQLPAVRLIVDPEAGMTAAERDTADGPSTTLVAVVIGLVAGASGLGVAALSGRRARG